MVINKRNMYKDKYKKEKDKNTKVIKINNRRRVYVEKKESESDSDSDTENYSSDSVSDSVSDSYKSNSSSSVDKDKKKPFISIVDSGYKKSKYGSKQDHYKSEDIIAHLDNYVALKTQKQEKILKMLPPFKTWIRYMNLKTKKLRVGGLLMKVEYPDYIMLVNPKLNLTWSVQLSENVIYIPDKEYPMNEKEKLEMKKRKLLEKKMQEKKEIETDLKDQLYNLYQKGQLQLKK